jgi:hypothetical protein
MRSGGVLTSPTLPATFLRQTILTIRYGTPRSFPCNAIIFVFLVIFYIHAKNIYVCHHFAFEFFLQVFQ